MADQNILKEGVSLYNHGNYTASLTYFLSLPEDCGADPMEMAYYLGLCYFKLGRFDDALLYLEQVVTSAEDENVSSLRARVLQCRYVLAIIYCESGRKKLADFELQKLLEEGYKPAAVYASLAFLSWESGDLEKCITYYEKSLSEDASNPTALNGLGYVLAAEGRDLTTALSYCKKAVDAAPESAACLDSLGWVYYKMGLYTESKKLLQRARRKAPANGVIAEHLKAVEEANSL